MPPKKKQQQIDLSTLPECTSLNTIILLKGKKARATAIFERIRKQAEKFMFKIKKSEVLDHAKEKNIYIDPSTLTDKQKKDAKFMESINTELTAGVVAKAVQSLISSLVVKARIEKKNNPDAFANQKRKYDVMYVFDDFPDSKEEFEELATVNQGVKYVIVIDPKINWANAPELPEQQQPAEGQEPEEEEEQIKEYKSLLKKEEKTEEDNAFQNEVNQKIDSIKKFRSESTKNSEFRNCTIYTLEPEIDPYNEQSNLNELVQSFFDSINKLDAQYLEYQQWRKGKQGQKMPELGQEQSIKSEKKGTSIVELLDSMIKGFDMEESKPESTSEQQSALELIQNYTIGKKRKVKQINNIKPKQIKNFVSGNEQVGPDSKLKNQLRQSMKYPGVNRFQMPQIPTKSQGLRKLQLAHYAQFLNAQMPIDEFFRRQRIANFEEYMKQFDEERSYSFANRVYEEQHSVESLRRELFRATEVDEAIPFAKYDDNTDKLYLMLAYRNNARRMSKKNWESNWKVIPNYEYWLKYFKNNENNLTNTHFYDIDYEQIGNIEQISRSYTLNNSGGGAVVVSKEISAGSKRQNLLYSIKHKLVFGVHDNKFYGQNGNTKVYHHLAAAESQNYQTVVLLDQGRVRVTSEGNVIFEYGGQTRLITPGGYTIIYGKDRSVILHPNGGITHSKDTYVNQRGYGLNKGQLYSSLSLERTAQNGSILKRQDGTVIVTKNGETPSKWIRFYEGTQYQVVENTIKIEKNGAPFIRCENGKIQVVSNELTITIHPSADGCKSSFQFKDGSLLKIFKNTVVVCHKDQDETIEVDVSSNQMRSAFGDEEVIVGSNEAKYRRKGKTVDAREDEQKYGEDDQLPADFIEPRLFVINNDNTGVELLSEPMVKRYIAHHQKDIQKIYEHNNKDKQELFIISKLDSNRQKFIRNQLKLKLDVFDNSNEKEQILACQNIAVRALIKYPPLTTEDIAKVNEIKNQVENWRKANLKEQNQFGHKPKDPTNLKSKIDTKLLITKMRQKSEPAIETESLKQRGIQFFMDTLEQIRKQNDQKIKQERIRTQMLQRRGTIIQHFKPIGFGIQRQNKREENNDDNSAFLDNYFLTTEGQKALAEMPEWVFRPKQIQAPAQLDPQIQNELNNTKNLQREEQVSQDVKERYDTVEVELNPRPEKQIYIKPSVFTQRQIDQERLAFESQKKAYKYHESKRRDFNVYGQQRRFRPQVRTLMRTQAISQINQKYLVTEAPLDKKVKISSMKNKLSSSACNMTQMRKQGPHNLLMKTLDKGNDINRLLEKRTMMVQADLNDKLQRDILITPVQANFGVILERRTYELKIDVKNQDVISQRLTIKRPKSVYVKVAINQLGPIAMGMSRKITVTIKASPDILGKFNDQFDIVTKHEIYHIPINAHIISELQSRNETISLSRGVTQIEETIRRRPEGSSVGLPKLK